MLLLEFVIGSRRSPFLAPAALLLTAAAHSEKRGQVSYISRVQEPTIRTPSQRAHAHAEVDIVFSLHGGSQHVKLTLEPNNDIIPQGATVQYLDDAGRVERTEPLVRRDYKVYKGNSWLRDGRGWAFAGWARIIILRDGPHPLFEGAFTLNGDAHHVLSRSNYLKTRHRLDPAVDPAGTDFMVVFRDSDIEPEPRSSSLELRKRAQYGHGGGANASDDRHHDIMCPSDALPYNVHPQNPVNQMILEKHGAGRVLASLGLDDLLGARGKTGLTRRQSTTTTTGSDIFGTSGNSAGVNLRSTIGLTAGCPTTRQVALVGVATDCTYTGDFPSEADARSNIIKQFNSAYALPPSPSLSLPLRELTDLDQTYTKEPSTSL